MSTERFDPYHKWLGIPPHEQPPNHYRLLGLSLFEADPDVIDHAADGRMGLLRSFQIGPQATWSQFLLSQVAAARACLHDPHAKRAYDAALLAALTPPPPAPPEPARPPAAVPGPGVASEPPAATISRRIYRRPATPRAAMPPVLPVMILGGGLLGLAIGYAIAFHVRGFDPLGIAAQGESRAARKVAARQHAAPSERRSPAEPRPSAPAIAARPFPLPTQHAEPPSLPPVERAQPPPPAPAAPTPPQADVAQPDPLAAPQSPAAEMTPPAESPTPGKELRQLLDQLAQELAAIVGEMGTAAQQEAAHIELIKDLDRQWKSKRLALHFPVQNVRPSRGSFTIGLGPPAEAASVPAAQWTRQIEVHWRASKALAVRPGDIVELSGSPRLRIAKLDVEKAFLAMTMSSPVAGVRYRYYLHLVGFEAEVRKASANK